MLQQRGESAIAYLFVAFCFVEEALQQQWSKFYMKIKRNPDNGVL